MDKFATAGLRTLLMAYRDMAEHEYAAFTVRVVTVLF